MKMKAQRRKRAKSVRASNPDPNFAAIRVSAAHDVASNAMLRAKKARLASCAGASASSDVKRRMDGG